MDGIETIRATLERIEKKLDRLLDEEPVTPPSAVEAWLEPGRIADRLGLTEAYVRKLCARGARGGCAGIRKDGGRWLATVEAIEDQRRVSGAF